MASLQPIHQQTTGSAHAQGAAAERIGKGVVSVGSIVAAVGAASCCVIPFALATIGISGAWIGNFAALAPYQPYFLGLAVLLLGAGFFVVYRKPRTACADGIYCARAASDRLAKMALWSAAGLVVLAAAFPYAAPRLFDL